MQDEDERRLRQVFLRNLDRLRKERELSLPELSERLGHHRTYLGKVYQEDMGVTLELLEKVAHELEVEPNELLEP